MSTLQHKKQSREEKQQAKRLKVDGITHRIIEIGRESSSVFVNTTVYHLHFYHILVVTDVDFTRAFATGGAKIDVGNGYREIPLDRIIRIDSFPLMLEQRRTSITEWVISVGDRSLAERSLWNALPRRIEQELSQRSRPTGTFTSHSVSTE